ncbi:MAG: hypothetical protein QOK19_1359 [Solirubrobacteraceae bacterium]|jgi:hypothetical protein|nr:hypothetical protein [Solirubrobacteraceae bacterium]
MRYLRRPVLAAALAVLALGLILGGCGSSSSSSGNGLQSKSPSQILEAAKAAASKAASVHINGTITSSGKPISLNMELLAGKGGKGTISQEGFTIKLIQVRGAVYINGSAAFYTHVGGSAAAQLLQGKWLKAPANSGELASLADLTNLSKLIDTALANHGKLAKGPTATIGGQKAIALKDTTKGGILYVATTGTPYPLEIAKSGKESGKVVLDRWNQPVSLSAPAGAIDIGKLQKAG